MTVCFMRRISYCDALREATRLEMARDPSVFVYGIGVNSHAKCFGTTDGLVVVVQIVIACAKCVN